MHSLTTARHGVSCLVEIEIQVLAGIDERVMDRVPARAERNGIPILHLCWCA
jgi:hypothetical protein